MNHSISPLMSECVSRPYCLGFHITVYSGYRIEQLIKQYLLSIDRILTDTDLLIGTPFNTVRVLKISSWLLVLILASIWARSKNITAGISNWQEGRFEATYPKTYPKQKKPQKYKANPSLVLHPKKSLLAIDFRWVIELVRTRRIELPLP